MRSSSILDSTLLQDSSNSINIPWPDLKFSHVYFRFWVFLHKLLCYLSMLHSLILSAFRIFARALFLRRLIFASIKGIPTLIVPLSITCLATIQLSLTTILRSITLLSEIFMITSTFFSPLIIFILFFLRILLMSAILFIVVIQIIGIRLHCIMNKCCFICRYPSGIRFPHIFAKSILPLSFIFLSYFLSFGDWTLGSRYKIFLKVSKI